MILRIPCSIEKLNVCATNCLISMEPYASDFSTMYIDHTKNRLRRLGYINYVNYVVNMGTQQGRR